MDNENKRDFHCLLTNPLICKITSELVRKLCFQPQQDVKNVNYFAILTYKQSSARKF